MLDFLDPLRRNWHRHWSEPVGNLASVRNRRKPRGDSDLATPADGSTASGATKISSKQISTVALLRPVAGPKRHPRDYCTRAPVVATYHRVPSRKTSTDTRLAPRTRRDTTGSNPFFAPQLKKKTHPTADRPATATGLPPLSSLPHTSQAYVFLLAFPKRCLLLRAKDSPAGKV